MRLYHVDRVGRIAGAGMLSLQPSGLSVHGDYYWKEKPMKDFSSVRNAVTEHFFESVRFRDFPSMPSRFSAFFACLPQDLAPWLAVFDRSGQSARRVWEVEADRSACVRLDASLLSTFWLYEDGHWFDPAFAKKCADAYWGQLSIETLTDDRSPQPLQWARFPLWECLVAYPVQVVRAVPPEEVRGLISESSASSAPARASSHQDE